MNNINKDPNLFTNKIKCFIFDFDDTLYYGVDWTEWNDMQQKWIRSHYQDLTDEQFSSLCLQATGKTNLEGKDIVQLLIKEEGSAKAYLDWRNSIDGKMSEFEKNGQVVSMDEIRKFRSQCDRLGGKMFIVSNSTQKGIEVFAKHYKIDLSLFDGIYVNQYSAEDATKKKIYQQIMNDNNLSNDQMMVIGNSYKQDLAPQKNLNFAPFFAKTVSPMMRWSKIKYSYNVKSSKNNSIKKDESRLKFIFFFINYFALYLCCHYPFEANEPKIQQPFE